MYLIINLYMTYDFTSFEMYYHVSYDFPFTLLLLTTF